MLSVSVCIQLGTSLWLPVVDQSNLVLVLAFPCHHSPHMPPLSLDIRVTPCLVNGPRVTHTFDLDLDNIALCGVWSPSFLEVRIAVDVCELDQPAEFCVSRASSSSPQEKRTLP